MKKIFAIATTIVALFSFYSTQQVYPHEEEKQARQIFEMSGKKVICRLEKKVISGTISQKELKLLYDIFTFYLREIVKENIAIEEEEIIFRAFKETALYYRSCSEEERRKEFESHRKKCGQDA